MALAFVPILLSLNKKITQPKAQTCTVNECSTAAGCQLTGYPMTLNGVTYTCAGNNEWNDPEGNNYYGNAAGPVVEVAVETPQMTPIASENISTQLQERVDSGDPLVISFDRCNIMFWNVIPPPVSVEQASSEAQQILTDVQNQISSGSDFQQACESKRDELFRNGPDYLRISYRRINMTDDRPGFTPRNAQLNTTVKEMGVGEMQVFPQIDGGYDSDDLAINDGDYHAGYFLVRKIQ